MCDNIFSSYILGAYTVLSECEDCANIFREHIPVACFTNFRDALFHFRKMAHSTEYLELVRQTNSIKEHVNRAKTDAITFILEYMSAIVDILFSQLPKDASSKKELKQLNAEICKTDLNYRLGGLMLSSTPVMRPPDDHMLDLLDNYISRINELVDAKVFKRSLQDYRLGQRKEDNHSEDSLGFESCQH